MGTAVARAKITPNLPADLRDELNSDALALKERLSAPSGDIIRMKNHAFTLPGADNSAEEITGVVVDWVSVNEFYEGAFNPSDIKPPVCAAVGLKPVDMKPPPSVATPQFANCEKCPKNAWKSDPNGKGKACKNQYLVAIVPPDNVVDGPLLLLKVPPSALGGFDKFVRTASNGNGPVPHPITVVVSITFDKSVQYNKPVFTILGPNKDLEGAAKRRKQARERLLTQPDIGGK